MYTSLIFGVIGAVIIFLYSLKSKGGMINLFWGVLIIPLAFSIGLLVSYDAFYHKLEYQKVLVSKTELIAMKDKTLITGAFFLASGMIGEEMYYMYYEKLPNGSINLNKILATNAVIFEDRESTESTLEVYEFVPVKTNWLIGEARKSLPEFHIPPGSIKMEIEMDLN